MSALSPAHDRGPRRAPASAWVAAAALLVGAAALLTWRAGTRPNYDAYGWLVWGHQTLRGDLDLNAAPSWKPLPWLFTTVFALLGHGAAMWLWMGTANAVSLAGVAVAAHLGWRLVREATRTPGGWPGRLGAAVAATLAGAALLAVHDEFPYGYLHYVLSAQSDPMIVACVLGALDLGLSGRRWGTLTLLWFAALGRPEAWPLLLAASAWRWRGGGRGTRALVVAALALVALLWFGVPALTSRSWFVAGENADASGFGPTGDRALGVLGRFIAQTGFPLQLAALAGALGAGWRRERDLLVLVAGIVAWMAVEVAFGLHGWPALGRYMFEPTAGLIVLGSVAVGRGLACGLKTVTERRHGTGGPGPAAAGVLTVLAAAVVGLTVPTLVDQGRAARADLVAQHRRTASLRALARTVDALGGASRLQHCGEVISDGLETQTALAYDVGENVNRVGYRLRQPGHPHNPIVVFRPRQDGDWTVRVRRQRTPACRQLAATGRGSVEKWSR